MDPISDQDQEETENIADPELERIEGENWESENIYLWSENV